MNHTKIKSRMPQIGEAIFCIAYLIFDLIAAVIFFVSAKGDRALLLFGVLTLACYFPVVLWGKKKPMVGMLMMPKTLAYVWMICMGLGLIRRSF